MIKVEKDVVLSRIKNIELHLARLEEMRKLSISDFLKSDNFAIASYNLRSALESTFDIAGHILARIPGVRVSEYKKIAKELGKQGIISEKFALKLEEMGGYRNCLTHFYFEVTPEEMYGIIQNDLGDFSIFMKSIKSFLKKGGVFND